MAVYGTVKPGCRVKVLQIAPTLGTHGGIEALAIGIAAAVHGGPLFVRTLFRWRTHTLDESLRGLIASAGVPVAIMRYPGVQFLRAVADADLVHCHYPIPWVVFAARALGKPVVLTVENRRQKKPAPLMALERRALSAAARAVFISRFVAKTWVGEHAAEGAEIMPAVTRFEPVTVPEVGRRGFVCVSRLIDGKGLIELVEAYRDSGLDGTFHPLTIAGAGPLAVRLKTFVECRPPGSVRLVGYVSDKAKIQLFAHAKWNVAPQTAEEDQGLTPLEARLCGVPSIASRTGGLPEAAGPGAVLCPPGDVQALRMALREAAEMSKEDYAKRCVVNSVELESYIKPLETYRRIYEEAADKKVRQDG